MFYDFLVNCANFLSEHVLPWTIFYNLVFSVSLIFCSFIRKCGHGKVELEDDEE
ncbi:MAG: hypothetical protein U0M66_04610 [Bacilli bacterium]|nr:hypothetical protein [Bacilli bacterium]